MNESDFHRTVDALLGRLEEALSSSEALEVDFEAGILQVACPDGSRIIVNRQTPNREIWVAARSGGFHFSLRGAEWRDTRSNEELLDALERIVALQSGEKVALK
jgi:CyaY protein